MLGGRGLAWGVEWTGGRMIQTLRKAWTGIFTKNTAKIKGIGNFAVPSVRIGNLVTANWREIRKKSREMKNLPYQERKLIKAPRQD